jgi:hypothetical protein
MSLEALKSEIEKLSDEERAALAAWLTDLDRQAWDGEIAQDFSAGGRGKKLLDEVDAQIERGNFKRLG